MNGICSIYLSVKYKALSSLNANSRATAICLLLSLCDLNNVCLGK
ncbi:hypothetical protein T12_11955 [Trichinella patagoniensis]|uniref:Uncharacterized protein n=1 Tax=Trichinella patagoniensis TaxID=990121 RepID=A0A0V0YR80_9BILA|nr:hypothetical protein T12_11955 [Trichinella patagoniensis]